MFSWFIGIMMLEWDREFGITICVFGAGIKSFISKSFTLSLPL
jgi:ribose 5-phosphate isomerase RpiB